MNVNDETFERSFISDILCKLQQSADNDDCCVITQLLSAQLELFKVQ